MTNFLSVYDKPVIIRNPANCRESKVLVEQNRINILSANVKVDFLTKNKAMKKNDRYLI